MKFFTVNSSVLKLYFFLIALLLISKISFCNEEKKILFSNELIGKQIDTKHLYCKMVGNILSSE